MMIQWVTVIIVMIPCHISVSGDYSVAFRAAGRSSFGSGSSDEELEGAFFRKRDRCETVVFVCGLHEGDRDGYSMHPFVLSMAAPGLFPQWDLAFQKLNFTVTPVTYPLLEACHSEINPTVFLEHTPYITTAHEDSATCPLAPCAQLIDCYPLVN